jgi:hypothetical protein
MSHNQGNRLLDDIETLQCRGFKKGDIISAYNSGYHMIEGFSSPESDNPAVIYRKVLNADYSLNNKVLNQIFICALGYAEKLTGIRIEETRSITNRNCDAAIKFLKDKK